jgi:hypothetical protein
MTTKRIIMPPPWDAKTPRSMGGAFDALYVERAKVAKAKTPKKRGPKGSKSYHAKVLRDLENVAPNFNTPIASRADSERNTAIRRGTSA